jgi:hypothetical protein
MHDIPWQAVMWLNIKWVAPGVFIESCAAICLASMRSFVFLNGNQCRHGMRNAICNEGGTKMNIMKIDMWKLAGLAIAAFAIPAAAAESPFITVEERLQKMDKDHDGMVTVDEVRAYIETVHGKDFNKPVMDEMVSAANSKSCGSPFSRSFY